MSKIDPAVKAAERAAGLRKLADLIEAHPELNATYTDNVNAFFAMTKTDWQAIARAALEFGAKVNKVATDTSFSLELSWGAFTAHALGTRSAVCEQVKVGEQVVTEQVPDPAAMASVPMVTTERVVELFEWRCSPLLADDDSQVAA